MVNSRWLKVSIISALFVNMITRKTPNCTRYDVEEPYECNKCKENMKLTSSTKRCIDCPPDCKCDGTSACKKDEEDSYVWIYVLGAIVISLIVGCFCYYMYRERVKKCHIMEYDREREERRINEEREAEMQYQMERRELEIIRDEERRRERRERILYEESRIQEIIVKERRKRNNLSNLRTTNTEDQKNNCTICMDEIRGTRIRTLSCYHTFHDPCITQWLVNNTTCPICRRSVN